MNNEIKEIIKFQDILNYYKTKQIEPTYCEELITTGELQNLLDYITNLQEIAEEHKNCTRKHWQQKCAEHCANEMIYKSRNGKAIEYIKKCRDYHKTYHNEDKMFPDELTSLIIILQGSDDNG